MKWALQAMVASMALGGLILVGTGCDECVDYCTTVADCYDEHMDGDWEDYGFEDYEDFLDDCDDIYSGPGRIQQAACRAAKLQYECDEDSFTSW